MEHAAFGGGVLVMVGFLFLWLLAIVLSLAATAFWIWMIVDCATNEPSEGNDKLIWLLVIVLVHLLGAILYYFIRRPQRKALTGR
jgi:hypothetical protein